MINDELVITATHDMSTAHLTAGQANLILGRELWLSFSHFMLAVSFDHGDISLFDRKLSGEIPLIRGDIVFNPVQ